MTFDNDLGFDQRNLNFVHNTPSHFGSTFSEASADLSKTHD